MRFARYEHRGAVSDGVLGAGGRLHGLGGGQDIDALIRRGGLPALRDAGTAALGRAPGPPVTGVRLLAPLHPASIRDSVSFEAHVEGARRSQEGARDPVPGRWYEAPCFYFTNPHVCAGAFDDVERFPGSEQFDLELEVGVVYGEHGRNLTPEQAARGIVGYTIFNDWSARDIQRLEGQLPFGFFKGKDGAHTLGPYLVTADELEPHKTADGLLDLTMRAWINGELLGEDSLANCAFTVAAWPRSGAGPASGSRRRSSQATWSLLRSRGSVPCATGSSTRPRVRPSRRSRWPGAVSRAARATRSRCRRSCRGSGCRTYV
jgi:2-keto-4-pentenoate hydratase/2-oxohepta-3-ene-1,7-dioic acid hydratase in catechol pathway